MSETPRKGRARTVRAVANAIGAGLVVVVLLAVSAAGAGAVPALGPALNPGTGVWADSRGGGLPTDQHLLVPGMTTRTTVGFESNGIPHIEAGSDQDMFRAIGYLHARFRIFQMDLERRQAGGRLAEIIGEQGVESDTFELDLGLVRAAERDLRTLPPQTRAVLDAYAAGVNAGVAQLRRDGTLPMYFKLLGYDPAPWTPLDSLLVQRLETQTLAYSDRPLFFSYLAKGIGKERFDQWLQVVPQNSQFPYDKGPYKSLPLQQLPVGADPAAPAVPAMPMPASTGAVPGASAGPSPAVSVTPAMTSASTAVLDRYAELPLNAIHTMGNSNAWAISGDRTASGKPILAADPHLTMSLPSLWFQLAARSPNYDVAGVTLPGVPAVLLGHNPQASWGITNSQHPTTLYYLEQTDAAHPDQYYWNDAWRPMNKVQYTINVKGGAPVQHTVKLTAHGPILTQQDITASVWFSGMLPSDNLTSILAATRASSFDQFHEALRGWGTPAENFVYADKAGDIGIVNAGYVPQVRGGSAYLPMSGTGENDVIGTVPFEALPLVHNPPEGVVSTANQREVTADYPYYYGRSYDFFDQGWRESEIVHALDGRKGITAEQMGQLQLNQVDGTARALLPAVLEALRGQKLNPTEQAALDQLTNWNYSLDADSAAATLWTRFITLYNYAVWHPLWEQYKIPSPPTEGFTPRTSRNSYVVDAMMGMLLKLSVSDPGNEIFSPSTMAKRTAPDVMRLAFSDVVKDLSAKRGPEPKQWLYGDKHQVMFASLLQSTPLDDGPYPYGGNGRVINSITSPPQERDGKTLDTVNIGGPSWRYVIDWGTGKAMSSLPGGTSENPTSPWYANGVQDWLAGRFSPMLSGQEAQAATKGRTWTLQP
jgi:penicillin amidase